jgi:hypothetical protein
MAWVPVETYYLRYNPDTHQCIVGVHYLHSDHLQGAPRPLSRQYNVPAAEAMFLSDMLRNEKPIFIDTETGALATGKEEVGEGERS